MSKFAAAFAFSFALAAPSFAAPISGLVNTGTASGGAVVLNSTYQDGFWEYRSGPDTWTRAWAAGRNNSFPLNGPWINETATSRWLTPTANFGATDTVGNHFFRLRFDLTGSDPTSAQFLGRVSADNQVEVSLNGNVILSLTPGEYNFRSWTSFAAPLGSAFVAGINELGFRVVNWAGNSGNPAGLRVEFLSSNAEAAATGVNEPTILALLGSGFLVLSVMRRREPKFRFARAR
jgi:hypothetical protein